MSINTLAPGFLLAAPRLGDPNFEKRVVLLGKHDDSGALGWVLNGRTLASVRKVLKLAGILQEETPGTEDENLARRASVGGPVSSGSVWMVYQRFEARALPGEIVLHKGLAATGDGDAIRGLAESSRPQRFRLFLGYAGWSKGQLETEIREGAWLPAAVDPELVFDIPADELWNESYQRAIGHKPGAFFSSQRGSA